MAYITEYDNTNIVGLQVEGHALESGAELNHLFGLDVLEAIDTSDTVTNGQDAASLVQVGLGGRTQDTFFQNGGNFGGSGSSVDC